MYLATTGTALGGKRKERSLITEETPPFHIPPHLRKEFETECQVLDTLVAFNRQVSTALAKSSQGCHSFFARKREGGMGKLPRTLRVCVYNVHSNQHAQYAVAEGGTLDAPRWTLRIEGRLLPDPTTNTSTADGPKFSHYIKHISVELDKEQYKNDWFVEWDSRRHVGETDGFELSREGDRETRVRILIEIGYPVQLYSVAAPLAALVGSSLETYDEVVRSVWFYCRENQLQTGSTIECDAALKNIFGATLESFELDQLPSMIRPLLSPPPPLELQYVVRVSGEARESMHCWDIQVQDAGITQGKSFMASSAKMTEELNEIDKELASVAEQLDQATKRQRAFAAMAADPVQFVHTLVRSQVQDAALLDAREDAESQRSANYYYHPYVVEGARQYLLRQTLFNSANAPDKPKGY
jgi:chromatin remodeling complex protein RSC6